MEYITSKEFWAFMRRIQKLLEANKVQEAIEILERAKTEKPMFDESELQ